MGNEAWEIGAGNGTGPTGSIGAVATCCPGVSGVLCLSAPVLLQMLIYLFLLEAFPDLPLRPTEASWQPPELVSVRSFSLGWRCQFLLMLLHGTGLPMLFCRHGSHVGGPQESRVAPDEGRILCSPQSWRR